MSPSGDVEPLENPLRGCSGPSSGTRSVAPTPRARRGSCTVSVRAWGRQTATHSRHPVHFQGSTVAEKRAPVPAALVLQGVVERTGAGDGEGREDLDHRGERSGDGGLVRAENRRGLSRRRRRTRGPPCPGRRPRGSGSPTRAPACAGPPAGAQSGPRRRFPGEEKVGDLVDRVGDGQRPGIPARIPGIRCRTTGRRTGRSAEQALVLFTRRPSRRA